MEIPQHFNILGSGIYFPRKIVDAEQIDQRLGKPSGWTREKIGVNRRFECVAPESLATMAREAVGRAMADARVGWSDIDLILDCSTSRHRPIPCNAVHVQAMFGPEAQSIPCFDIQSTCLGFLVALNVANGLMQTESFRHVLIVCSEAPLRAANWAAPQSAALLSDGAAAFILRRALSAGEGIYQHESYSDYIEACSVHGGGHLLSPLEINGENRSRFLFHMDGKLLMRTVIKLLRPMVRKVMSHPLIDPEKIHIVPHPGSPGGLSIAQRVLDLPEDRFHVRIAEFGNLVAAGIPITLHQCLEDGTITKGDQVMLLGTSAGYSQAAMVFRV